MCFDMGDSEVLRNFNDNNHHNLTSCSSDCTMYAYIEVYFIIYFRGINILSVFKKKNALIKSLLMQILCWGAPRMTLCGGRYPGLYIIWPEVSGIMATERSWPCICGEFVFATYSVAVCWGRLIFLVGPEASAGLFRLPDLRPIWLWGVDTID